MYPPPPSIAITQPLLPSLSRESPTASLRWLLDFIDAVRKACGDGSAVAVLSIRQYSTKRDLSSVEDA